MCLTQLIQKNPSGKMIGPGNSLWFLNLMLNIFGSVGLKYKKLIKNHASVHDACGFMMSTFSIGPGYIYGLFIELLKVSSAGVQQGHLDHFFSRWSGLGQISGLFLIWKLMKNLEMPIFNNYDETDQNEEIVF